MDDKPSGINAQAHRVADERERHKGQQHCQYQQDDAHTTQVGIYLVHQVFHIRQVAHPGILAQLLGNPLQRITVGIVGRQLNLQGGREGIKAQELRRVAPQLLDLLALSLLLTDIVDVMGIGAMIQVTTQQVRIVHRNTVFQHHRYCQILLHMGRQVACRQHEEHHHTQQDKHHCSAYTQRNSLHTTVVAGSFSFLTHYSYYVIRLQK